MKMKNNILENIEDVEKIGENEVEFNDRKLDESNTSDDNETGEDPGQPEENSTTEKMMEGISLRAILNTIPRQFRQEASEYFQSNGIVATLSTQIIPRWGDSQRSEAVEQVLGGSGDDAAIYAAILIKLFKVDEHIQVSRSHIRYIQKTFYRFRSVLEHLQEKTILAHDQSKLR